MINNEKRAYKYNLVGYKNSFTGSEHCEAFFICIQAIELPEFLIFSIEKIYFLLPINFF